MNDYDPTRPFQPSEPDPSLDWEDDEGSPKLLWGRVLALFGILLIVFLIGRASAPDDSADDVASLREELASAQDEVADLEAELATATAAPTTETTEDTGDTTDDETDDTGDTTDDETDDTGDVEVNTYTVKSGDSYYKISEKEFGDPSGGDCISDANDDAPLNPGDEIEIPETCDPNA